MDTKDAGFIAAVAFESGYKAGLEFALRIIADFGNGAKFIIREELDLFESGEQGGEQ